MQDAMFSVSKTIDNISYSCISLQNSPSKSKFKNLISVGSVFLTILDDGINNALN